MCNYCGDHKGWDSPKNYKQPSCELAQTIRVDCNSQSYPGGDVLIPVVLGEVELQTLVESKITMPTPTREIKNIRRNVLITECKAIPSATNSSELKVFVSGKIHKNIQFVEDCSGYIKDFSIDVPFNCNLTVPVTHLGKPHEQLSHISTLTDERIFIDNGGHEADPNLSGGLTFEFYNEQIECRLLFSLVNDLDINKCFDKRGRFKTIIEKAEVVLIFKLIQLQQVRRSHHGKECKQEHDGKHKHHESESSSHHGKESEHIQDGKHEHHGSESSHHHKHPPIRETKERMHHIIKRAKKPL
jgi:hypothetical protein